VHYWTKTQFFAFLHQQERILHARQIPTPIFQNNIKHGNYGEEGFKYYGEEGFKYFLANFNCNGGTFLRKMFSAKSFPQRGGGQPIGGRNLPISCLGAHLGKDPPMS